MSIKLISNCLLFVILCASTIFFMLKKNLTPAVMSNQLLSSTVDSIAVNVAFQEFDQSGKQVHAFASDSMRHIQKNNTHMFTQPRVQIISSDQPPMTLRADQAIALHSGKTITFNKNVQLSSAAVHNKPASQLNTESLTYLTQTQQVFTQDKVSFKQEDTHGSSQGMTANLANHQLKLIKDVVLDKPTTHLRATSVTTYGDAKQPVLKAMILGCNGHPAHYWGILKPDEPPMHAHAQQILFDQKTQIIELNGQARIIQGPQSFTAPKISYDLAHQHVISTPTTLARTTIVIYPENHT